MELDRIEAALQGQPSLPPVARWDPPLSGEIDIHIDREGGWFHEGTRIERQPLVNLFASILRREADGCFYLVTPVEKWRVTVEDAPLLAVALESAGVGEEKKLIFKLNTNRLVPLDADHPLEVRGDEASPRPYITAENGLSARLTRPVYYQLVEMADERGGEVGVTSGGVRFSLHPQEQNRSA